MKVVTAILIVVVITLIVYWIQMSQAGKYEKPTPIYIAKPNWYVGNMLDWEPQMVLYDGGNYYYSDKSHPK